MSPLPDPLLTRKTNYPIESIFLRRWSPRAMRDEPISDYDLMTLFEAARWAPSTYNEQEWRFLYACRESAHWATFLDLLVEANRVWCQHAGVLVVTLSRKLFTRNGQPNPVHSLDAGAAMENLALQGAVMGLVVHSMAGVDREKARQILHIPGHFDVEAMIAIGHPGDPEQLPPEVRAREEPSLRRPLEEIVREGLFTFE